MDINLKKINILNLDEKKLKEIIESIGEKKFRFKQIMKWIYHNFCDNFDNMSNISINLKKKLKKKLEIKLPVIQNILYSKDGTIKYILNFNKQIIETIYIPEINRKTICISSQVGCILNCKFCATGKQGFKRNLKVSEIIGQIWCISKMLYNINPKKKITNIVIMGMGEPLLNVVNVINSIKIMLNNYCLNIKKNKITLSTSGIIPAFKKIYEIINIPLAFSLHASNNELRNSLMPINIKYNIESCLSEINKYIKLSKSNKIKFTIEYIMLNNINDNIYNAYQLIKLLKNIPSKINLIPFNKIPNTKYESSPKNKIYKFAQILKKNGLITTIRKLHGNDINAACGQLSGNIINKIKNNI
ncbi:23S rRNA (adenine(2503)-C(2))-methyltransferase RlmN [Candidatus Annandia pinicola]|uniref:23S rRNA (adenine(2503)-C(2))-methyltransferase RlmN n=1 Tax=Candidatus Annandia pinicola TaxID=1345117 RepID=UPI001D0287FB|nr:23S rRNA (adenine(2503)-C(2))-methyltransferase RlmN [Candidatus Annandia pinicola]UDG80330.1 Dual-specificity RNA methyltransferase RlmN [Candidatus Annandia pinicola]